MPIHYPLMELRLLSHVKNTGQEKYSPMKIWLLLSLIFISRYSDAQSLSPTVVASQGGYFSTPTVSIEWTLGEVMSETFDAQNHFLTQGFHQPNILQPEVIYEFFNGFSPNGDGVNDWWKIPVLSYYSKNLVIINNRWGDVVWKNDNYDNKDIVFSGQNMYGQDLPDGTYYYIIRYNNTEKRGWIFIKR